MPGSSRVVQKDVKKVRSSESKTPRVALRSPIAARKKRSPEVLKPRRKLVSDDACSGMTRPKEGAAKPKGQSKKIVLPAASHDGDENLGSSNGIVESREAAGSSVDVLSVPVKKRRGRPPRVKSAEDTIGSSTAEGKSGPQSGEGIPGKESTKKKVVGKQSAARQQSVAEMVNSRTQKKSKGHQRGRQVSSSSSTAKTSEKEDEGDGPRGRARRSVSSSDESDRRAAPKTRVVSRATPSKGSNKKETPRSKKESPSQKESSSRSLSARGRKKVVKIAPEKNRDESLTDDEKKEKIRVKKKVGRRKSRVASLNAMAMVHCMYENEALRSPSSTSEGGASRGDARSPETFEEKADKKKPSRAVTKKKEQKKTETVKKESSESDERPLKDLVMPKRIASLNASAILAASYSPMEPPKKKWINEIVKKEQSEGGQSQPSAVTSEESKPMKKRKIDVSTTDGEGSSGGKRRKEATESSTAGSTSHRGEAGATVSSQEIKVDEGDSNSAKGVEEMDVIVADQDLTFAGLAYINRPKDASTAEFAVQTYRISSRSCPAPGANGGKVTLRSQTVVHKTQETQILQRPGQISEVTSTSTKSYSPLGALSTMRPTLPPTMSLATATVDSTHHHHSVPITPMFQPAGPLIQSHPPPPPQHFHHDPSHVLKPVAVLPVPSTTSTAPCTTLVSPASVTTSVVQPYHPPPHQDYWRPPYVPPGWERQPLFYHPAHYPYPYRGPVPPYYNPSPHHEAPYPYPAPPPPSSLYPTYVQPSGASPLAPPTTYPYPHQPQSAYPYSYQHGFPYPPYGPSTCPCPIQPCPKNAHGPLTGDSKDIGGGHSNSCGGRPDERSVATLTPDEGAVPTVTTSEPSRSAVEETAEERLTANASSQTVPGDSEDKKKELLEQMKERFARRLRKGTANKRGFHLIASQRDGVLVEVKAVAPATGVPLADDKVTSSKVPERLNGLSNNLKRRNGLVKTSSPTPCMAEVVKKTEDVVPPPTGKKRAGKPAKDGEKLNGEKLNREKLNGEKLNGEKLNREKLNGEKLNREKLNGEKMNREKLNGEKMNREKLNGLIPKMLKNTRSPILMEKSHLWIGAKKSDDGRSPSSVSPSPVRKASSSPIPQLETTITDLCNSPSPPPYPSLPSPITLPAGKRPKRMPAGGHKRISVESPPVKVRRASLLSTLRKKLSPVLPTPTSTSSTSSGEFRPKNPVGRPKKNKAKVNETASLSCPQCVPPPFHSRHRSGGAKWSNGWRWIGEPRPGPVFLNCDDSPVIRQCYSAMEHLEGDVIRPRDCVLLKSGPKQGDLPYVAKVAALFEDPVDGEMKLSVLWYYRPEQLEAPSQNKASPDEVFASRHRDISVPACVEDKCYVLTFNEYLRYRSQLRREEEDAKSSCASLVPPLPSLDSYPRKDLIPSLRVPPDRMFFCYRVYDFRQKRILKNPS